MKQAMKQALKPKEINHIRYTRTTSLGEGETGEVTERYIFPFFVPSPNVKAVDITGFTEEAKGDVAKLFKEYVEYYEQQMKTVFTFENWLEHSRGPGAYVSPLKWRTFKAENIEVLED